MEDEIKAGDVVWLKSGGDAMSVVDVTRANGKLVANLVWMLRGCVETQTISIEALTKIAPMEFESKV